MHFLQASKCMAGTWWGVSYFSQCQIAVKILSFLFYNLFFFRNLRGCWWHNLICKAVFSLSWMSPDSSWQAAVRINLLNILTLTQKSWTPHGCCCFALFFARILKVFITFPRYSLKRWTLSSRWNLLYFISWSRNKSLEVKLFEKVIWLRANSEGTEEKK